MGASRGRPSPLSYALFDFDGVVLDTEPLYMQLDRAILTNFGYEPTEEDLLSFVGKSSSRMGVALLAAHGIDCTVGQYKAARPDPLGAIYANPDVGPIAGLPELWAGLDGRGVAIAVVSTSACAELVAALDRLGLMRHVSAVVGRELVGRLKPDPEPYLAALGHLAPGRDLAEAAREAVVVDDSPAGIASARAAGAFAVGFQGASVVQGLPDADLVVGGHAELAELLRGW